MIPYRKMNWGLILLLRFYGSAVVRTTIWGVVAMVETILLYELLSKEQIRGFYAESVPYLTFPAFAAIVAFLVTFRQTFSYNRYHEGRVSVQNMSAEMFIAFTYALSFDNNISPVEEEEEKEKEKGSNGKGTNTNKDGSTNETHQSAEKKNKNTAREQFRYNMVHAMSLMHAVCLQHLRCDWDLNNLCKHNENLLPAWDSASTAGFTIRWWHYIWPRDRVSSRTLYHKASKIQVVGGVTRQEHLVLGTTPVRQATLNKNSRENVFEEDLKGSSSKRGERLAGLWTSDQACYMRGAAERPYKVIFSTLELIRSRAEQGGLNMPSPILATMWQAMNSGIQAFEHCRYLSDTPFPFPWAQLIIVVLVVWQALIPLTVIVAYNDRPLGVVMAMASTWILWALNEVAREIEDPFTQEPNDLPLARLQYQFNERLLAVAAGGGRGGGENGVCLGWEHNPGRGDHSLNADEEEEEVELEYQGGLEATETGLADTKLAIGV